MNPILETIYNRRAIRKYKNISVDPDTIEALLDAGRMAPSAINMQPWKFYVLTDKNLIGKFDSEIKDEAIEKFHLAHGVDFLKIKNPIFHDAPVVIFITAPKDNEWAALDVGMCAENIMLAAKTMGLDTCPVGLAKFVEQTKLYSQLSIPSSEHILLSLIIGYGDEKPLVHERKKDNVVYIHAKATSTVS